MPPFALPGIQEPEQDRYCAANMWHVSKAIQRGHFDVVHSFARLAYLTPLLPLRVPKIMSYQRPFRLAACDSEICFRVAV